MISDMPISIIGGGRVGIALGILAARAGLEVVAVGGRSKMRTKAAAKLIGKGVKALDIKEAAALGKLVFITVSDDAILPVCSVISMADKWAPGAVVAHCSGALSSETLQLARQRGAQVGSMHPLQTFATIDSAVDVLPGSYLFIEGDPQAVQSLTEFGWAIGGKCVPIEPKSKVMYHVAAVMACNYVASLLDAALTAGEQAGIERRTFMAALEPLVQATVHNVLTMDVAESLTGPIVRRDIGTITTHLETIKDDLLANFYRSMGAQTIRVAIKHYLITAQEGVEMLYKMLPASE
jgi:predicted short-subunit dehydrogenase-like oxidoreductase (DUF2520 family)